jgi:hypothetical protein
MADGVNAKLQSYRLLVLPGNVGWRRVSPRLHRK